MKFAPFLLLFVLASCNSNEITESKDVSQENIYQYYSVNYKEGDENAEVLVQFRFGSITGTTIMLNKPSMIRLDEKEIKVDSSTALGAYYRVFLPVSKLYGKHIFEYTDMDKKVFRNEFDFEKFSINVPDSSVSVMPFILKIISNPLKGDDRVEIVATETDSTFKIVHTAADSSNAIVIPEKEITRQRNKYLTLEPVLFRRIPLQQNTTEGGEIEIRYVPRPFRLKLHD